MKNRKFEFAGEPSRLDAWLPEVLEGYPRSLCKEMVKNGSVLVNGAPVKPSMILQEGDSVEVALETEKPAAQQFRDMVLMEDKALVGIAKPAGLLVHPLAPAWENIPEVVFTGEVTLVALVLAAYPKLPELGLERIGLVHRLDRETSGVMLIAKTVPAQKELVDQFQSRTVSKTYICAVKGVLKDDEGVIDVPIGRVAGGKLKASPVGRDAVTEYKVLERRKNATLVQLHPRTGRTNQLRVHMSWLGHPVLGDSVYGGPKAPRLLLHSRRLEFVHPSTGKKTVLETPPPPDFRQYWQSL